jgi:hypothetical protein
MNKFFMHKSVSVIVMIAFLSMICVAYPGHSEQAVKTEKQENVKTAATEAEATAEVDEYYSRDDANVIEDEGSPGAKKKKFPWLLVVGGVVVVGVVLYFLVFKTKKFELTVNVSEGVTGSPAAGTSKLKKGSTITYNYSLAAGYEQLSVKLDGVEEAATGSFEMDAAHTLSVTAMKSVTGNYVGKTNQNYTAILKVSKVSGISTLSWYQIKLDSDLLSGFYLTLTITHLNPAVPITNYHFTDKEAWIDLTGDFTVNGTTTVAGTWELHYFVHGYGTFRGIGTYNASTTKMAKPASVSKLGPEKVKISCAIYTQDGRLVKRFNK